MNIINVQNLSMSFGDHVIFRGVDFAVDEGEKVALMGPNGVGKTTLFRILSGQYQPDDGIIALRTDARIGHLSQQTLLDPEATPRQMVAGAVAGVHALIAEYDAVSARMARLGADLEHAALEQAIHQQDKLRRHIELAGGWDWQRRIDEVLGRLGLADHLDHPVRALSGGQRRRVALAQTLIESPDLLLMDEPTNHLDTDAVEWLEGWLRNFPGGLLLITHDRYFLEQVVGRIIEVTRDGFYSHPGTYRAYITRKTQRQEVEKTTQTRSDKSLEDEFDWLTRGVKARGRTSKSRLDEVERAIDQRRAREDLALEFPLADGPSMGPHLVSARGLYKGYMPADINLPKVPVLQNIGISVVPGDKIGLVGPNGCGKSTLLKCLVGRARIDAGLVEVHEQTRIGYLPQDEPLAGEDADDANKPVYEAFSESDYVWIGDTRHHKRAYLGGFLFDRTLLKTPLKLLSGGQRRRFHLAKVFAQNANLLVLDEPTNDLDIASLRALETALIAYKGCLLVVSHDRYFLNVVCNSICAFEDDELVRYWGDYDQYRRTRDAALPPPKTPPQQANTMPGTMLGASKGTTTDDTQQPAIPKKLTWKERQRLTEIEGDIEAAEAEKTAIEAELADPNLYAQRPDTIPDLNRRHADLVARLDALFEEWQALEARA